MRADLVLLHGFTQTGASWEPVTRAVAGSYKASHPGGHGAGAPDVGGHGLWAPDLRGHGTRAAARPVSFAAVLEDLDELVAPGATLAGYSMGGRLALAYALARPGRVGRLVLVGASPGLADPQERARRAAADAALADRIERIGVEAFAAEWAAQPLFADQSPAVAAAARADRLRNDAAGLAAALRGLGTGVMEPLWDRLGELRSPVALVVGERDAKFRAIAERMRERLPDAELVVVAGAGHAAQLEQPEAVAQALEA